MKKHTPIKSSGIYKITNAANGHCYIGSSVNIGNRWNQHRHQLRRNTHHSSYFQHAWNKYGEDCFSVEILELCVPTQEALMLLEQHYLDTVLPQYNILTTAYTRLGFAQSESAKEKIGNAHRGKPKSEEHRRKIGEAQLGRVSPKKGQTLDLSSETRAAMGSSWRGKTLPQSIKDKMSEVRAGRKHREDWKTNIALGVKERHSNPTEAMVVGRAGTAKGNSEWRWITNGVENKRVHMNDLENLEPGFVRGRTIVKKV